MTQHDPERRLVLATNNAGKVAEFRRLLEPLGWQLCGIREALGHSLVVDETGATFRENAELKARALCEATGAWALADDSGLEVDALGGLPGVRSARFAGEGASDDENNRELLWRLEAVPDAERTARFRAVIVLASPTGLLVHVEGCSEGVLLRAPRGTGGFGYDPLFSVPELDGRTFAELEPDEKDRISHRGRALRELRQRVLDQLLRA